MEIELTAAKPLAKKPDKKTGRGGKPLSLAEMRRGRGGHSRAAPPPHARPLRFSARHDKNDEDDEDLERPNERGGLEDSDDEEQLLGEISCCPAQTLTSYAVADTRSSSAGQDRPANDLKECLRQHRFCIGAVLGTFSVLCIGGALGFWLATPRTPKDLPAPPPPPCNLKSNKYGTHCPGSATTSAHAACSITVVMHTSCTTVRKEIRARLTSQNGWQDRKSHPGTYSILKGEPYCVLADRTTGPGASPGPYTDKFGLTFRDGTATAPDGTQQPVCEMTGCSESQVPSTKDFSTNFCNMYNLYCNEAAGCKTAELNLPTPAHVAYGPSCTHAGEAEHDAAQCTR